MTSVLRLALTAAGTRAATLARRNLSRGFAALKLTEDATGHGADENPCGRPLALDLFCKAGGASMGLYRAGFDVVVVDIEPQPRYPFCFVQADALNPPFDLGRFDFIWASPPCQAYSVTARIHDKEHPDLVAPVRDMLRASGVPYVIENVPGSPLVNPMMLCGTMFGLRVFRHRLFEASFFILAPAHHQHRGTTLAEHGYSSFANGADMISVAGHNFRRVDGAAAMGIDWPTTRAEIANAIPPAYSEFIGRAALAHINSNRAELRSPRAVRASGASSSLESAATGPRAALPCAPGDLFVSTNAHPGGSIDHSIRAGAALHAPITSRSASSCPLR